MLTDYDILSQVVRGRYSQVHKISNKTQEYCRGNRADLPVSRRQARMLRKALRKSELR